MCKVSGADGSVDLIDPSSSGIRLHLLVAPFGDPVHLQIETAILRIDRAKPRRLEMSALPWLSLKKVWIHTLMSGALSSVRICS